MIASVVLFKLDLFQFCIGKIEFKMRGGGGRSFSSRGGRPGDRDYGGGGGGGGKFRGNSYRDGPSSGGRFNNQGRRFDDNNRNRSRYDRRSPDRFHGHNDRSSRVITNPKKNEIPMLFMYVLRFQMNMICRTILGTIQWQERDHAMK